ncbi:IS66 family insertion sequence element accessory protein TnpA [Thiolapillus sp.]|uniref:IS66 family insertion sequence element accessory protein TnpA n=1 Tax=Thiolapillus sp. TaxID=2017437 RepID=UPI003AF832A8
MFAKQKLVFNYISTNYVNFLCFLSCTELRYSTFGYWVRKLRRVAEPTARERPSGFVPVIPDAVQPTGLTLSLPNGLEIRGIEVQNLPVVKQLLAVL